MTYACLDVLAQALACHGCHPDDIESVLLHPAKGARGTFSQLLVCLRIFGCGEGFDCPECVLFSHASMAAGAFVHDVCGRPLPCCMCVPP